MTLTTPLPGHGTVSKQVGSVIHSTSSDSAVTLFTIYKLNEGDNCGCGGTKFAAVAPAEPEPLI